MKIYLLNFIFEIILISLINADDSTDKLILGENYPGISCGKENPKREKDCTKYGTDSGMLCCMVSERFDYSGGKCFLLSSHYAEETLKIKDAGGRKEFFNKDGKKEFWSCGNKCEYYNINLLFFVISIFLILY